MYKKNTAINLISGVIFFITIAVCLAGIILKFLSVNQALWIGGIVIVILCIVLTICNYKTSNYGGKFHQTYPDAKK